MPRIPGSLIPLLLILFGAAAECQAQYRPTIFFREDWKETPPETPVTQEHVANDELLLSLYGVGADSIKKSNHERPVDDPFYVWSGLAVGNWAVTLKNPNAYADLSEFATVTWRSKQSGLRCLRVILKTADDAWLVSGECDGPSSDWRIHQFNLSDVEWYELDIDLVVEKRRVEEPDLSRVEEIGFTDLMRGGGSPASSRLDWIEVHGHRIDK